ncbi:MAG: ABC transporter ATP-binding protein [Chloroflexi bacterium]|nr:ABC transporter ATP-binding protein [Chloroflexota bacterium]
MNAEAVIRTHGLRKSFGAVKAVDGVDLLVQRGEVFGFLGPNGAGKTTTIGMLLGLLHPTAGTAEVLGQPVTPGRTAALRRVGALVGAPGLYPYLSGRDNLRLLARVSPDAGAGRVEEVLALVGLADAAGRKVKGYSTGMKQRLGLAAALLHRPELLILDEPTNGLDPAGMRDVRELLRNLAADGVTVFLSSHLLHEVEQACDRAAVLNHGRVIAQGAVSDLRGSERLIKVRVPDPQAAAAVLAGLPGVGRATPNGHYVEVSGVTGEAVVGCLSGHGIVPGEVTTSQGDLESVFLALTQES